MAVAMLVPQILVTRLMLFAQGPVRGLMVRLSFPPRDTIIPLLAQLAMNGFVLTP